jgi:hypothetical protein
MFRPLVRLREFSALQALLLLNDTMTSSVYLTFLFKEVLPAGIIVGCAIPFILCVWSVRARCFLADHHLEHLAEFEDWSNGLFPILALWYRALLLSNDVVSCFLQPSSG